MSSIPDTFNKHEVVRQWLIGAGYSGLVGRADLTDKDAIHFYLTGYIAFDPQTGAHLTRSHGRSKGGNAPRYTLSMPAQPSESYPCTYHHLRAWSDAEAVAAARAYLAKRHKAAPDA